MAAPTFAVGQAPWEQGNATPSFPVGQAPWEAAPAPSPGLIPTFVKTAVSNQARGGVSQIESGLNSVFHPQETDVLAGAIGGAEGALRAGAGAINVLTSPLAPLFAPVGAAVNAVAGKVSDIPAVQKFAQSKAGEATARTAEDLANAGVIAGTIAGAGEGAAAGAKAVKGSPGDEIAQGILAEQPEALKPAPVDKSIIENYTKAIKPTTAGKTGPGQLDAYNSSVVSAVKSITENKDNLTYDDGDGNIADGQLPKTRAQLADAIEQSKQSIFSRYNALTKQTTGMGVTISLEKPASTLQDVIDNPALQISHPEAISYAKGVQTRFQNPDGTWKAVDPTTVEKVVANYNADLKSFYRNPTYGAASRAAIDAGVVHSLREMLGDTIENATGEAYNALKRQYGALASIEKDVNRAALAQLKQTGTIPNGVGKYIDIFSGGDIAAGLLSLNPALFAKGIAQHGILKYFQWLNSPDRAVRSIFKQ